MSNRRFLTLALIAAFSLAGMAPVTAQPASKAIGKPDKPDKPDKPGKPDNAGNENKPAKVTWNPSRIEMSDVDTEGTIVVELSADKEVLGAGLFTSGSLRDVLGLPTEPIDIPEGETVLVEFELLESPEDAGRTIGGTVQLLVGGKHVAKPLSFSLKRESNGDSGDTDEDELIDSVGKLPVSWLIEGEPLEDITLDLFDDEGFAVITLVANRDLTNLGLWFTPSVNTDIAASFDLDEEEDGVLEFDDDGNIAFVAKGTEVTVILELLNPAEDIFGGGTLHVRSIAGNSRSYPGILGVRFNSDPDDEEEGELPVSPAAVVDAASFEEEPVSASQIISIFGVGLGSDQQAVFELDAEGKIGEYLNGTMVLFDGYPARLLSTSAGQINAIVPSAVRGGDVELQVLRNDKLSALFPVPVGPPAPSLFTLSGTHAAAINEDGTLNTNANPAAKDTIVSLFGTGGGPTQPPLPDGAIASEALWLAGQVRVLVGGVEAAVLYAGAAPGIVSAVSQYNIRLSPQTPKGFQVVQIFLNGVESLGTAQIYVQ